MPLLSLKGNAEMPEFADRQLLIQLRRLLKPEQRATGSCPILWPKHTVPFWCYTAYNSSYKFLNRNPTGYPEMSAGVCIHHAQDVIAKNATQAPLISRPGPLACVNIFLIN